MRRWLVVILTALMVLVCQVAHAVEVTDEAGLRNALDTWAPEITIVGAIGLNDTLLVDYDAMITGGQLTILAGDGIVLDNDALVVDVRIVDDRSVSADSVVSHSGFATLLDCDITAVDGTRAVIASNDQDALSVSDCTLAGGQYAAELGGDSMCTFTGNQITSGDVLVSSQSDSDISGNAFSAGRGITVTGSGAGPRTEAFKDVWALSGGNGHCVVRNEHLGVAGVQTADGARQLLIDASDACATLAGAVSFADGAGLACSLVVGGSYTNTGTDTVPAVATLLVKNGATFTQSGGALTMNGGLNVAPGGSLILTNGGAVNINAAAAIGGAVDVQSGGTLNVSAGTALASGSTVAIQAGGTLNVLGGGTVDGDGSIKNDGALTGSVAVDIRHKLTCVGDVTQVEGVDNGYVKGNAVAKLTANAAGFDGWTLSANVALADGKAKSDRTIHITLSGPGSATANEAPPPPAPPAPPTEITTALDPPEMALKVGAQRAVKHEAGSAAWSSSDEAVAAVDENGLVTARAPGSATITARASGYAEASCLVTVVAADEPSEPNEPVEAIDAGIDVLAVVRGKTLILPKFKNYEGTWTSSDESVARIVKNGRVNALRPGTVELTYAVTAAPKKALVVNDRKLKEHGTVTIELNVVKRGEVAQQVALDRKKLSLRTVGEGNTARIAATVKPEKAIHKQLFYISSDPSVARVDDQGVVTALSAGKCKISVVSASLKRNTIAVTVTGAIAVLPAKKKLKAGKALTLTAAIDEALADKSVAWASSDERVATVDENGVVTALAKGKATITATASNGETAKCAVTVRKK